jgi:hypothetical protein
LSDEHLHPERWKYTTASTLPTIASGNEKKLLELWKQRIGAMPLPDYTDDLAVNVGRELEPFMCRWIERTEGVEITERQRFVVHPEHKWFAATLDGVIGDAIYEGKVYNGYDIDEAIKGWTWQVLGAMRARSLSRGLIYALHHNSRLVRVEIDPETVGAFSETEMWQRAAAFQLCVDTLSPPSPLPELVPPEKWRSIDLRQATDDNWVHAIRPHLDVFTNTHAHAELNKRAREDAKALLPDDVGKAQWHGITLKRSRNGAVRFDTEAA